MKKINTKRIIYRIRHDILTTNNIVILAAFFIAIGWATGSVGVLERNYKLQREIDTKQRELKLAELEVLTLRYEQRYFKSDEYKELAVRQRLGLVMPGEKVLILPPNSKAAKTTNEEDNSKLGSTTPQVSNTEQWFNFLLGTRLAALQE
jgi:cell division protein FtsB